MTTISRTSNPGNIDPRYQDYPLNLALNGPRYSEAKLKSYQRRLGEFEEILCVREEKNVELPIIDLCDDENSGTVQQKSRIHSFDKLLRWFGISGSPETGSLSHSDAETITRPVVKSRFIYLFAENSRDSLRVTIDMLKFILSFNQVMPEFLELIWIFGSQSDARAMNYSKFYSDIAFSSSSLVNNVQEGQRSLSQHFQLCYVLKGVTEKRRHPTDLKENDWSVRQVAVLHKFSTHDGTALWLVTKGRLDIRDRYCSLTGSSGRAKDKLFGSNAECFNSSLAAHLMYCYWSTEDWDSYIQWLELVIEKVTILTIYEDRETDRVYQQYQPQHVQDLQYWEEKVHEAVLHIESNANIMGALRRFYEQTPKMSGFPPDVHTTCSEDLTRFQLALEEMIDNAKLQVQRLKLLDIRVQERKDLMLQHLQGQTNDRTLRINQNLEKDQISMRIITLVTLFFLPATFVSTFFSTDIATYEDSDPEHPRGEHFSLLALERWFELAAPLTLLTLFLAWMMSRITGRIRKERDNWRKATKQRKGNKLVGIWQWLLGLRTRLPLIKSIGAKSSYSVDRPERASIHNEKIA